MASGDFGLRLKELREVAGLTQPGLAEKAGMSKGGIADLEQGVNQPSWDSVRKLAAALGVTTEAFNVAPSPDVKPAGRGRPKAGGETPTAPPRRRTGRAMPGKARRGGKRPPAGDNYH
jgi:transcriptional regulator with XRE-family HTH domain